MDVELQILKHLKRDSRSTVLAIDNYCSAYNDLFSDVRSYECFKCLHQGIISGIKRKSLPEISKVVGILSAQSLHHFMANSPWSAKALQERRLSLTLKALKEQKITVIIDEREGTLKENDTYQTKIELASSIVTELVEFGFKIELVLADSLYGEAGLFIRTLEKYQLPWVVAIRSNHGVWLSHVQKVRANKWCKFERAFTDDSSEIRYIREIIYSKRNKKTYWQITTNPQTMPENSTSFVMTNIPG